MKTKFTFEFKGFEFDSAEISNLVKQPAGGPDELLPLTDKKGSAKIEGITLQTDIEYTPEELLQVLKNQGTFIAGLPALIDSCVMAFRVAMSNPIKPPTETE